MALHNPIFPGRHRRRNVGQTCRIAICLSTCGLLSLAGWWLAVLLMSGFAVWSPLAAFTTLYLAWRTRSLYRSFKAGTLDRHPLFTLGFPEGNEAGGGGGGGSSTAPIHNASLTQGLVGAGAASSGGGGAEPPPKRRGTGGFNPFASRPPAADDCSAGTVSVTPADVAQGAAWAANNAGAIAAGASWAANNPSAVAAVASCAGAASGAASAAPSSSSNPFCNNAHLRFGQ